jgi:hypothetical protein
MGKNFIFVMALSLIIGALSTHWLNVATSAGTETRTNDTVDTKADETVGRLRKPNPPTESRTVLPKGVKPAQAQVIQVTQVNDLVNRVAKTLYAQDQDFEQRRTDLVATLSTASAAELSTLARTTTDVTQTQDQRTSAVYLLTLAGPKAIPALAGVVMAPFRETPQSQFELAVRTTALERLDRFSTEGISVETVIRQALKQPLHPTLRMLAQVSLQGLLQHRPGKLTRFAEKNMESTP